MTWARRVCWAIATPFRATAVALIGAYQATLAGALGGRCRFSPSCSHYAQDAIRARGMVAGLAFAMWRILRCHPFGGSGIDPAPGGRHGANDVVIRKPSREVASA